MPSGKGVLDEAVEETIIIEKKNAASYFKTVSKTRLKRILPTSASFVWLTIIINTLHESGYQKSVNVQSTSNYIPTGPKVLSNSLILLDFGSNEHYLK